MHNRTHYPVRIWTGKQLPEMNGDRLIQLSWKSNEKVGRKGHSSRCVSVPVFQAPFDSEWEGMLVDAFEQLQKKIAHTYVTAMLDTNGGVCNDIPADVISPEAVLATFNMLDAAEDSSRGKLSADQISRWFHEQLKDVVVARVAEANGWLADDHEITDEERKKCEQAAAGYRATLEKLAAPTPRIEVNTAKALKKAVELLPDEMLKRDLVAKKLLGKLEKIINPPEDKVVDLASL